MMPSVAIEQMQNIICILVRVTPFTPEAAQTYNGILNRSQNEYMIA